MICLLSPCTIRTDPGKGRKIGRIVKLSHQGVIFKTWEGQLLRGGLNDGSGSMGQAFDFTIEDESLITVAQVAFEEQKEVIIEYRCEFISSLTRSQNRSPYFCEKITLSK